MAHVYKDPEGNFVAITADGRQVPVLPDLAANAKISGWNPVRNEQGVSAFQRFTVKNLAKDPEAAAGYLRNIGYEVRHYGSGFNFAVRPANGGPRAPWKVIDPDGFDPQDILDLTGDAVSLGAQGIASIAAGPAGMGAESAVVGGAAGAVEAGKQALGAAAGVPDNVSAGKVAAAGVGGAVSVPIAHGVTGALKSSTRFLGKMARGAAARFAGIEGSRALPGADALLDGAHWAVDHPGELMKTPEQAGQILRDAVYAVSKKSMPEKQATQAMTEQAAEAGHTLNLRPTVDAFESEMFHPSGVKDVPIGAGQARIQMGRTAQESMKHSLNPDLQAQLERTVATIHSLVGDDNLTALPVDKAMLVKNYLQQVARQKGAYTQAPPGRAFRDLVTQQAASLRQALEDKMTNAGFSDYVSTMRAFEAKTAMLHDWSKALRVKDRSAAAAATRSNFVRSIYSDSKTGWLQALDDLETTFGVQGLKGAVREAQVGRVTGLSSEEGPSLLGRGMRSQLGLGALAFGHPGVAAAELAASSPRGVMAATKAGVRLAKPAGALTAAAAKAGSMLAAQETAKTVGTGISRDDAAPRPGKTRIGL